MFDGRNENIARHNNRMILSQNVKTNQVITGNKITFNKV